MRPVYLLIEEVNRELLSRLLIGRAAAALGSRTTGLTQASAPPWRL